MAGKPGEAWGSGDLYEQYIGRWSRQVAREFLIWLDAGPGLHWGDVGCGTGALVEAILSSSGPASVIAVDSSEGFILDVRDRIFDSRVNYNIGNAMALPWKGSACGATVSGLVLNFVPDPKTMLREMVRVTQPGGTVGVYVWDYADGMQMMRYFWDVAMEASPKDSNIDEAVRFPICRPGPLEALFRESGMGSVSVCSIVIPTVFRDFDDYWTPFLAKQGAAPTYLAGLDAGSRDRIRNRLRELLPAGADGSIALTARAWAVQGKAV